MECNHGRSRGFRQEHRAWLSDIFRSFRAVDSEGHSVTLIEVTPHTEQSPNCATAARSANFNKAESADDPAGILAVEAIARHDTDSQVSPDVDGGENTIVPERKHHRPAVQGFGCTIFE